MTARQTIFRTVYLSAVFLFSAGFLSADEVFTFQEKEDWTQSKKITFDSTGVFTLYGPAFVVSNSFPVDPSAEITVSGESKALPGASDKTRFYLGILNYDKNMKRIEGYHNSFFPGAYTVLAAPVSAKDTVIKVKDGSKFRKGMLPAFFAKEDCSDLPNFSVDPKNPVVSVEKLADGTWKIVLSKPAGKEAKAGTGLRGHYNSWYQYLICGEKIPADWKRFSFTLKGCSKGDSRTQWWRGTANAKLGIFDNQQVKGKYIAFRNIKVTSRGGKVVSYVNRTPVSSSVKEISAVLPVSAQSPEVVLHFADGSVRKVKITPESLKYKDFELKNAYIKVSPFLFRYKVVNVPSTPPRKKTVDDLKKIWEQAHAEMDKTGRLSFRKCSEGVEVWFNGSFVGRFRKGSPLTAVSGIPFGIAVRQMEKGKDDRYLELDLSSMAGKSKAKTSYSSEEKGFLDLSGTAKKNKTNDGLRSFAKMKYSFVWTVPAEQYPCADVVFAVDPDKKQDPAMTLRLTRYVDHTGYTGRAYEAMADTLVEVPEAVKNGTAKKIGTAVINGTTMPVYRMAVRLDSGKISDLVYTDRFSTFPMNHGRYLDFEIMGRCTAIRNPMGDTRMFPDPRKKSAVRILSVSLEKAPVQMEPKYAQPGNIFHNDEKPEAVMSIRPLRQGNYKLCWTITDAENRIVRKDSRTVAKKGEDVRIDLAQKLPGWYGLDYELYDGKRLLMTHKASFALLGKDTRKAEVADSPYGCWDYGGAHYNADRLEVVGPVLYKAGFRRSAGIQRYPLAERRKWKLCGPSIGSARMGASDAEHIKAIRDNMAKNPGVKQFLIFHEHAPWSYQTAPELTGQKFDSANKYGDKKAAELWGKESAKRAAHARQLGRIVRKHFPELRILLGNSLGCTELIAETIRSGFPEEYADYVGLEVVGRNNLPERQWESSLQAGELMRMTAQAFGYHKWKINACFECNYRLDSLIGGERQAEWYVRDLLLMQAWRMPDIFIAIIMDCGNSYAGSFWGATGLCVRNPYIYPKKSYVAIANATKLLDQVTDFRRIPAGDECVYIAEFKRRDGKYVTAIWSSVLKTPVKLKCSTSDFQRIDFYGRPLPKPSMRSNSFDVTADGKAQYILSGKPVVISAQASESKAGVKVPADHRTVVSADQLGKWQMKQDMTPELERKTGIYMPYRTKGTFAIREVTDPEQGKCLEITLSKPDLKLPVLMWEYGVLMLKDPVTLEGDPASLGMLVKGNSGWGQMYFVVQDAAGKTYVSCGTRQHNADVFDYDGRASLAYTGWNYMSMPMTSASSIPDLSTGGVCNLWETGKMENGKFKCGSAGSIRYPVKLVGIGFAVHSRELSLTERKRMDQTFRVKKVTAFDFQK